MHNTHLSVFRHLVIFGAQFPHPDHTLAFFHTTSSTYRASTPSPPHTIASPFLIIHWRLAHGQPVGNKMGTLDRDARCRAICLGTLVLSLAYLGVWLGITTSWASKRRGTVRASMRGRPNLSGDKLGYALCWIASQRLEWKQHWYFAFL